MGQEQSESASVMLAVGLSGADLDRVRAFADDRVVATETLSTSACVGADVDPVNVTAILGASSADDLSPFPRLDWVHSGAAGVDAWLAGPDLPEGVQLTSAAGNGGIPLAEHAMMLMLMLNRDAPRWLRAQSERRWDRYVHGELHGLTLGIVGLGNAGADLARKAQAFGMRVLGMRRRADLPVDGVDRLFATGSLHDMLAVSDFVVVTAPLTPETKGMFGTAEFSAMKSGASFVCISRGGIADDEALLEALRSGAIGAGLDAHDVEPLPPSSPFWDLPNVIITPHNGATTEGTRRRGTEIMVENVRRYCAGEPLLNVVDREAGY